MKLNNIISILEEIAPNYLKEEWDNIGLLVGDNEQDVKKILITLDVTKEVIEESIIKKVDLIISHHPVIFQSIRKITKDNLVGEKIFNLIKNNISVVAMHTNYDIAIDGTNDLFFKKIGLINKEPLKKLQNQEFSLGRIGFLKTVTTFEEFSLNIKKILLLDSIKVAGSLDKNIKKVAICTGSASSKDFILECIKNKCDCYITSDIKHHDALDSVEMGLNLIDATHYATEFLIVENLANRLKKIFLKLNANIEIFETKRNVPIFKTL